MKSFEIGQTVNNKNLTKMKTKKVIVSLDKYDNGKRIDPEVYGTRFDKTDKEIIDFQFGIHGKQNIISIEVDDKLIYNAPAGV